MVSFKQQTPDEAMDMGSRLQLLFDMVPKPDGGRFIVREVAREINVTASGLQKILQGISLQPRNKTLHKISEFFGVGHDYFQCKTRRECIDHIVRYHLDNPEYIEVVKRRMFTINGQMRRTLRIWDNTMILRNVLADYNYDFDEIFDNELINQ